MFTILIIAFSIIILLILFILLYHLDFIPNLDLNIIDFKLLYTIITIRSSDITFYNDYDGYILIQTLDQLEGIYIYNKIYVRIIKWKCSEFSKIYNITKFNIDHIVDIDISDECVILSNGYKYYIKIDIKELSYIIRERKLKKLGF
jgi:hypothetical protein